MKHPRRLVIAYIIAPLIIVLLLLSPILYILYRQISLYSEYKAGIAPKTDYCPPSIVLPKRKKYTLTVIAPQGQAEAIAKVRVFSGRLDTGTGGRGKQYAEGYEIGCVVAERPMERSRQVKFLLPPGQYLVEALLTSRGERDYFGYGPSPVLLKDNDETEEVHMFPRI